MDILRGFDRAVRIFVVWIYSLIKPFDANSLDPTSTFAGFFRKRSDASVYHSHLPLSCGVGAVTISVLIVPVLRNIYGSAPQSSSPRSYRG